MTWTSDDLKAILPDVQKAVSEGLKNDVLRNEALNEIVVLDPHPGDFTKYVQFKLEPATAAEPGANQVTAQLDGVWQLEYTAPFPLEGRVPRKLDQLFLQAVTKWAEDVRRRELTWVLTRLREETRWRQTLRDQKPHQRVILLDTSLDNRFKNVTTKWLSPYPDLDTGNRKVIVYEDKDPRPLVSRLEDFALNCHLDPTTLHTTLTAKVRLHDFCSGCRYEKVN